MSAEYPCARCGRVRHYSANDVRRGRPTRHCQPCSVAIYNAGRSRKSAADKAVRQRKWFEAHRHHLAVYYSGYRERMRLAMVNAYGGACVLCGETDPVVLVLDHIADDAQLDRIENNHKGGFKLYALLKRSGWPRGRHQLLCHNCNFRKEYYRRKNAVSLQKAG